MEMTIDAEWQDPIKITFRWLEGGTGLHVSTPVEVAVNGDDRGRHLDISVAGSKVAECGPRTAILHPVTNQAIWRPATQDDVDRSRRETGDYPLVRTALYRKIPLVAVTSDSRYPYKLLGVDGAIIDQKSAEILAML